MHGELTMALNGRHGIVANTRSVLTTMLAAALLLAACGAKLRDDENAYRDGPGVVPAPEQVTELECLPTWRECIFEEQCCYGPCRDVDVIVGGDHLVQRAYCLGCYPPGFACTNSTDCCGRCSIECDVRDAECEGVCFLALSGDPCRANNECLYGACEDWHCL